MTYKIGDVVRLKSGGVPMCVTAYHRDEGTKYIGKGTVSVTWLTTDGVPKSYAFDERLVVEAVEEQRNRILAEFEGERAKSKVTEAVARGYQFCSQCGKSFPDGSPAFPCDKPDCSITRARNSLPLGHVWEDQP